jgi:hypothetical protein
MLVLLAKFAARGIQEKSPSADWQKGIKFRVLALLRPELGIQVG